MYTHASDSSFLIWTQSSTMSNTPPTHALEDKHDTDLTWPAKPMQGHTGGLSGGGGGGGRVGERDPLLEKPKG